MRKFNRLALVAGLLLVSPLAFAGDPAKSDSHPAPPPTPNTPAAQRLEKLKSLAGAWAGPDDDGDGKADHFVVYRVMSGGSAVAEYLLPGTKSEMVSIYHLDGDDLVMTHYCSMGNQPRMKAKSGPVDGPMVFEFTGVSNLRSPDEVHIHDLELTIVDSDHVNAAWKAYQGGKPMNDATTFKIERVKDSAKATEVLAKLSK